MGVGRCWEVLEALAISAAAFPRDLAGGKDLSGS